MNPEMAQTTGTARQHTLDQHSPSIRHTIREVAKANVGTGMLQR